jgi:molybdopterin converting factor small subunit
MSPTTNSAAHGSETVTITVSLIYYNIVADLLERRTEEKQLTSGITAGALLSMLAAENPALVSLARSPSGELPSHLRLFRGGKALLDPVEPLAHGDEIRIFPAITGG